jgi:hypothetical protein
MYIAPQGETISRPIPKRIGCQIGTNYSAI